MQIGFCKAYRRGSHLHLIYDESRASLYGKFVGCRSDVARSCRHCGAFIPVNSWGGYG